MSDHATLAQTHDRMALLKELLTPRSLGLTKIRVGAPTDGGYILAAELIPRHRIVYSLGIGGDCSFDAALAETCDRVLMFDGTIPGLPQHHPKFQFYNTNVDSRLMNASLDVLPESEYQHDILLKMDIEGSEYELFGGLRLDNLLKISQICMELHFVTQYPPCIDLLVSLLAEFELFHIHANNNVLRREIFQTSAVIDDLPDVLELTWIRKDRYAYSRPETQPYPIEGLDFKNQPDLPDVPLNWWLSL